MLLDYFVKAHVDARKVETKKADVIKIEQGDTEFRHFVAKFNKKRMIGPHKLL